MQLRHRDCFCREQRSTHMYYGIGGTILLVLVILLVLGRL
jgi:hypothetical protein